MSAPQYRDWSISDEEHEAVENVTDDAWNALTARPRLRPLTVMEAHSAAPGLR